MGFLVIRQEQVIRIHLDEIAILLIESTAVSITATLLCQLTKKKIKVIFCDEKRNPSSELLPYYGSHDTSIKIRKQISWTSHTKSAVWTEIVSEKIHKQYEHLRFWNLPEAEMLKQYQMDVEFADATNREGHAAKVYFNSLFGKSFTRTEENSINAALNYGYSLILSAVNREIVSNGYLTQIGIFHDNMFNKFNLSSDLMEPYRPVVDYAVKSMMPEKFDHDEKMEMVKLLSLEVIIGNRKEFLLNAIKIYVRSVFDSLNDNDSSLIKFYRYEL